MRLSDEYMIGIEAGSRSPKRFDYRQEAWSRDRRLPTGVGWWQAPVRGDRRNCAALMSKLAAPDALVRYHVLQAAGHLGCIGPEILQSLAERDDNEDIRNLAATLLKERRD